MTLVPPEIEAFFVYSDRFGVTEQTEDEKVLYYWPSDAPPNDKMNNVGLCQGVIGFASMFNPDGPMRALHLEKRRFILYHPDNDNWIVMLVKNAYLQKKGVEEMQSDLLDDTLVQYTVEQAYRMFRLFHGGFDYILENFSVRTLRDKLELFFPHYLSRLEAPKISFFSAMDGIHFLPVDKNVYLQIYCFVNHLENTFPLARQTCFLYDDHLVWAGVEQEDMRVLYRYVASFLHGEESTPPREKSRKDAGPAENVLASARGRVGFLTGPADLADPDSPVNVPQVYVGTPLQQQILVVYQYGRITLLLLMDPAAATDFSLYRGLAGFVDNELRGMVDTIAEQFDNKAKSKEEFKYVYFNHMNLALKSSLKRPAGQAGLLSKDLQQLVTSIHNDFQGPDGVKEVSLRHAEGWVVGRRSGQREFYVLFDKKEASLVQVGDDVSRLCDTFFGNIFIE